MAFTGQRRALEDIEANEAPTNQKNGRKPTPLWTPPPPYTIPEAWPQLPWPVPLMLTPVAPPLTEGPALPPLPDDG